MSVPIPECLMIGAGNGNTGSQASLESRALINQKFGSFTMMKCKHHPPCRVTIPEDKFLANLQTKCPTYSALLIGMIKREFNVL